jgi:DNA-binding transcriptional LysR family regulator
MNLSTRQIRYVCEVAKLGSIQSASSSLHISQSSILAAIAIAEDALEAKIFDRRPARGVQITRAGERFVTAARALLAANHEFEREVGALAKETPQVIRIACFEPFGSLFITEVLKKLVDHFGSVEFVLLEGDQSQLREWLANGTVDLIITYDIGPSFGDYSVTPICKVPAHAIISINDPLASQDAVTVAELSTRSMILLDLPETSTYLLTVFDMLATRPRVSLRTRSYETARSAVSAGLGFSVFNMRPSRHASADSLGVVRKPLADVFLSPTLIVADIYGTNKPMFIRTMIDIINRFFHDWGPSGFSVTVPDRANSLFEV